MFEEDKRKFNKSYSFKEQINQILKENKEHVVGYIRTAQKDESKIEIRKQENIIKEFCKECNINCNKFYIDDGFSGRNLDRPGIEKITKSNKEKIILVSEFSKFSRNMADLERYINTKNKIIIGITDAVIIKHN